MLTVIVLSSFSHVHAQELAAGDSLQARIGTIDQQVKTQSRLIENLKDDLATKDTTLPKVQAGIGGFQIQTYDGSYTLKIKGLLQSEGLFFTEDKYQRAFTNTLKVRRARLSVEGSLGKNFEYRIQPEFAGIPGILDGYIDGKVVPEFNVRIGKFRPFIGLEGIQPSYRTVFAEQGLVSGFAPSRDVGAQLQGIIGDGLAEYELGYFNGAADAANNDGDYADSKSGAGRVVIAPLKPTGIDALVGLAVGFSGSYSFDEVDTNVLPKYKTAAGTKYFGLDSAVAKGDFARYAPNVSWYVGPVGLQYEYFFNWYAVKGVGVKNGSASGKFVNRAWQVVASVILTGEDEVFKGFKVRHPLNPSTGDFGAIELGLRTDGVYTDGKLFDQKLASAKSSAGQVFAWGSGLNWYPSNNIRVTIDYDQTRLFGRTSAFSKPDEDLTTISFSTAF